MYTKKDERITPETEIQEVYMALGEYQGKFDALSSYIVSEKFIQRYTMAAILGIELPTGIEDD